MEQIECSETSAYKIQTPGNYPEENTQHSEYGESLKSRIISTCSKSQPDDDPTGSKHVAVWILYKDLFHGYLFTPLRSNYSVTAFASSQNWRLSTHMKYRLTYFLSAVEPSHGLTLLCSTSLRSTRLCTTSFHIHELVKVSIWLRFGHVSKMLVFFRTEAFSPKRLLNPCRRRHYEPSKRREPLTQRHDVTPQNTWIVRTSSLALVHITVSVDVT